MKDGKKNPEPAPSPLDIAAQAAEQVLGPNPFVGLRSEDLLDAARQVGMQAIQQPTLLLEQEAALARDLLAVFSGQATTAPAAGDKRFGDNAWRDNPFYRMGLQAYLAWGKSMTGFVERSSLEPKTKERAAFATSLLIDALAPTNTLLGNPAAMKKVIDSGGASLIAGLQNMISDLVKNQGMPSQVDRQAFGVGRNLALSPGAVIYRNDWLELIQYSPSTSEVYARPHIIVPPQINKYYIFDLAPGKSIAEYLTQSGYQVFVVSWRNPTPVHRDWDMDSYVAALLEAIAVVRAVCGSEDVNVHAACSGAMTLSALLGHLAAKGERLVNAATLMVAVLDSTADSQLGLFSTPSAIALAKQNSAAKGVLDGQEMGRVFAWMRPNDLIWNYWVSNYLLGNPPPAFDILYWNNDTTRLPARFHAQILDIFTGNQFRRPGEFRVLGTPIDLSKITSDNYVVAGITDHITPWKGVYNTARLLGAKTQFVLSSSGHIQSLINPPGNPKAKFLLNPTLPPDSADWLGQAQQVSGSWWEHWREWLASRSGDKQPARIELGNTQFAPREKAPGTYVMAP
jgi:polyhydroxyalkanoate synthase